MTDQQPTGDDAAIEALCSVNISRAEHLGTSWLKDFEASAILAAIQSGNVPGLYSFKTDFHDLWKAAEKDKDALRARCEAAEQVMGTEVDRDTLKLMCISADAAYKIERDKADAAQARVVELTALLRESLPEIAFVAFNKDINHA